MIPSSETLFGKSVTQVTVWLPKGKVVLRRDSRATGDISLPSREHEVNQCDLNQWCRTTILDCAVLPSAIFFPTLPLSSSFVPWFFPFYVCPSFSVIFFLHPVLSIFFMITSRGELSYLAPLGSENISAPYFKQCLFQGGITPQTESNTTPPSPKT